MYLRYISTMEHAKGLNHIIIIIAIQVVAIVTLLIVN
ncbi:MAG: hypothetical protein ACJAZ2_002269 [Glaciecola sp.]|jgi:hypothetical protein